MQPHPNPQWISYAATAVVVMLVLFLRLRRMRQTRPLRLETLWVVPAVMLMVLAVSIWEHPPATPVGWLWLALALVVGVGTGWQRGKLMRLTVDPLTHRLNQQSSPAALLFIVALILARRGLAFEAEQNGVNVFTVTGILFAFAFGLLAATRAEIYLRAKRLLAEAKAR